MFGVLNRLKSLIWSNEDDLIEVDEDEETILQKIKEEQLDNACLNTGIITKVSSNFCLVENREMAGTTLSVPTTLLENLSITKGDEITFMTVSGNANQTPIVKKVTGKVEAKALDVESVDCEGQDVRTFEGRVVNRRARVISISPGVECSLDLVSCSYIPLPGDLVTVNAIFDNETVSKVKSIQPAKSTLNCVGEISQWCNETKTGTIDKTIYFDRQVCQTGYLPLLEDKVTFTTIESHQGSFQRRAIDVAPISSINNYNDLDEEDQGLLKDKRGIRIVGSTNFGMLQLEQTKQIKLQVKNTSQSSHTLLRAEFHSSCSDSQMTIVHPKLESCVEMPPRKSIIFQFECKACSTGSASQLLIFYFKGFRIGRYLTCDVLLNNQVNDVFQASQEKKIKDFNIVDFVDVRDRKNRISGPRFGTKMNHFRRCDKPGVYKIDEKLWKVVVGENNKRNRYEQVQRNLEAMFPYLLHELSSNNYKERFHMLLYLEEIQQIVNIRQYDMQQVCLLRRGEYLALEVPGLSEHRPSLTIGDKVILKQPWSEKKTATYEGIIYKVQQTVVLIKFHSDFHNSYDESVCDVFFETSMHVIYRCHDSVNRAIRHLGFEFLLPSSIKPKRLQLNVTYSQLQNTPLDPNVSNFFNSCGSVQSEKNVDLTTVESVEKSSNISGFYRDKNGVLRAVENPNKKPELYVDQEGYLTPGETKLPKKEIRWFNDRLNSYQKVAVANILRGEARPLPYIIFGPPGTGKTVTLVEVILQLYRSLPKCRMLVATPSNSSSDLICEKLLDSGVVLENDLVRLVSFSRLMENRIPERLVPYSSLYSRPKDFNFIYEAPADFGKLCSSSKIGQHAITIGTCSTLDNLYQCDTGFFTHVLVDEAGQASEPEILMPIGLIHPDTGQVIMSGDPQQLGPVITSYAAAHYGLADSFLQRYIVKFPYARDVLGFPSTQGYDPRLVTRLAINYRSVPEILYLPNTLFYDDELIPTVSATEGREADIIRLLAPHLTPSRPPRPQGPIAMLFHGVRGSCYRDCDSPSLYNPQEVWEVARYLQILYSVGLTEDDVGVITPYNKQVFSTRKLLLTLNIPVPKIGSVEEFQGQERHVIILSTVLSPIKGQNPNRMSLGFISSPRRVNVALTRARAVLIIIGNPHILSVDTYWRHILAYCVGNNSYVGCDIPQRIQNLLNRTGDECEEDTEEVKGQYEGVEELW